jgi:hypothetical protein
MGLDAVVYCDCFEKGRLLVDPKATWKVYIDASGCRSDRTLTLQDSLAFDQWNLNACEHESGILLHHRIGNIAAVGLLRCALSEKPELFPITLTKIVYDGTHAGDFIAADQVLTLESELKSLSAFHSIDADIEGWIRFFEDQLRELVEASLRVAKPISF